MYLYRLRSLFTCLFLAGFGLLQAQVTTSTITGRVLDDAGNGLSAANIVAVHQPTGTQYGVITQDDGRFRLANLRPGGPYTLVASFVGFDDDQKEGIALNLGQTLDISFLLKSAAVQLEGVEVVAYNDPVLNDKRTGAATNVGSTELQRLPTISRSAADYTRLMPASDGNSFGGRNDQYNNFSLDGTIFNNPFGLDAATPGGQSDAQPISLDAIDQIQVNLAPYDVTQAGFTGAAINAVTKSGTNTLKGTVFGFYRNQDMTGSKVEGESIFVPDLGQFQTGFSLGGPLVKNKLFFFVNAEIERREDLGSNFIAASANRSGEQVSRVEAQDLEQVSNVLKDRFGYETGPYENYIHNTNNEKAIAKLDWNINRNNTLTITYNFLNAFKEKPAHPNAITRRGPDATTLQFYNSGYRINNVIHSGLLEWRSMFSANISNKLQVGMTAFRDTRDPFSDPFPVINIQRAGTPYIIAGHEPFSIFNRLNQDVFQFSDNLSIFKGNHTITIGTSLERFAFDNSFNLNAYGGTFGPGFESVEAFVNEVNSGNFDDDVAAARALYEANGGADGEAGKGWALAETNVGQWALYLQDEWAVGDNLKITAGLRMDMPLYFDTQDKIQENIDRNCCYDPTITYYDETGEALTLDHTVLPEQKPLFSPRVGFNYNVGGNNTSQLRGGTGLFTGRFPFVWIGNQVANPNFFFYCTTAPDFKFPQVWRSNLGFDQKLGGWTASIDVIYTKDINGMMVRNYGLQLPSGQLSGPDNRPIYLADDRATVFGGPTNAYVFTNTNVGYSFNTSIQLQRNWSNGWYTSIGYNFLDAKDASSIEAEISSDAYDRNPAINHVNEALLAPSLYGNRHRIVGSAHRKFSYGQGRWATTVATFFQYAQGGRFSYTYSGDINNDGSGLNDLIYIPTEAELQQMQFAGADAAAQRTAFNNFINQSDYLSERRGEYAEKYAILSPWYGNWDVRVLQDMILPSKQTVQLSLDVLNIGNLISSNWGVRQLPVTNQPLGVSVADGVPTYSFDSTLKNSFTNDFSLLSRWQFQVGLRFIF